MSRRDFAAGGVLLVIALGAAGGCQRALFPEKEPRTQFEAYDRMRYGNVPMEQPDVFGNPQPALRERLSRSRTY